MKKVLKPLSVIMSVIMLFSCVYSTSYALDFDGVKQKVTNVFEKTVSTLLGGIISGALGAINLPLRDNPGFVKEGEFENTDFYSGNDRFLTGEADGNVWRLGSASVSLVPADYREKTYYIGGFIAIENFFTNKVEEVADDMKARVIALDDNSGRGVSLFATVDCIGITNKDIKHIRRLFASQFAQRYPDKKLASVNVFSTHTHSCIDTEGLWTNLFAKIFGNIPKNLFGAKMEPGTDREYMDFLFERVAGAMMAACGSMKEGKMTCAVKDIGEDYFSNKNRKTCSSLDTRLTRLVFTPNDGSKKTVIVNMGAHPDVAGLPMDDGRNRGRTVSGDYIYYMGEFINNYGCDFMFFNGAICGIYIDRTLTNDGQELPYRYMISKRYGCEMAKIALAMTMTKEEIMADPMLYDQSEIIEEKKAAKLLATGQELKDPDEQVPEYTLWCEKWEPVKEVTVEPYLNIRLSAVPVPVTNNLIKMAGKLNLANYDVIIKNDGSYELLVEIGYMELGSVLKVAMVPGEFCADLIKGGSSLTKDGSFKGKNFPAPTLYDIFGDVNVFGLANDAIGYIVPDNDYSKGIVFDHYQELISLGEQTASSIMNGFVSLKESIK